MPEEKKNQELDALIAIVNALKGLDADGQERVLSSLLGLLGRPVSQRVVGGGRDLGSASLPPRPEGQMPPAAAPPVPKDVRTLKEEKQPKSDVEMALLVAYHLAEEAPAESRKHFVTADDITKYFKQAHHKLPKGAAQTLRNAKHAGYLDSAGTGAFKLNPVGYNLVVHGLPRATRKPQGVPRKARVQAKRTPKARKPGTTRTRRAR